MIEVRYVAARELNQDEQATLVRELRAAMEYPYDIRFTRVDAIPLGAGGKYDDFKSMIGAAANTPGSG